MKNLLNDNHVERTKNSYKQIFTSYSNNNLVIPDIVRKQLDKFLSLLPGNKILDVGCANGRESKYLFDNGLNVTGCDIAEEFVKLARADCSGCEFFVADMRKLNLIKKSFDGIWASAAVIHVPKVDSEATLQGFNKILNTNGVLYLSVMEGSFDDLRLNNLHPDWPERHFSDYTEAELTQLLETLGFSVLSCRHSKTDWVPPFYTSSVKRKSIDFGFCLV